MALPTTFRNEKRDTIRVDDDITTYLKLDLDVSRINRIHSILWMAGRPLASRPLHRYTMLDTRILRTEQADLHIVRNNKLIYIKPLPRYLLSSGFWREYLCDDEEVHLNAAGMLLSYTWLIISEIDFEIARENKLVPEDATWPWWKAFVADFLTHIDPNALIGMVNRRYHYGELRLGRINTIYRIRFVRTHFIRGYLYRYNRYSIFFQRNFGWMLVIFVYFSLVLSAMQVGVSLDVLDTSRTFQRASYGFVVFSLVLVAAVLAGVGLIFTVIFSINTGFSIAHKIRKHRERKQRIEQTNSSTITP